MKIRSEQYNSRGPRRDEAKPWRGAAGDNQPGSDKNRGTTSPRRVRKPRNPETLVGNGYPAKHKTSGPRMGPARTHA